MPFSVGTVKHLSSALNQETWILKDSQDNLKWEIKDFKEKLTEQQTKPPQY